MATTARSKRTSAPKADTQAEVPATNNKPSIWTRIKNGVKRIVGATKRGVVKAAKTVAKPFKATGRFAARAFRTIRADMAIAYRDSRLERAFTWTGRTSVRFWYRALRPVLRGMLILTAAVVVLAWFAYAPIVTIVLLALIGVNFLLLANIVEDLEYLAMRGSRAANIALKVLEVIGRTIGVLAYLCAACLLVATAIGAPVFGVVISACMAYLYFANNDVREMPAYSEIRLRREKEDLRTAMAPTAAAFDAAAGAFDAAVAASQMRIDAAVVAAQMRMDGEVGMGDITPSMAPDAPETWTRGNFLRAKGTEELWGTSHDVAPTSEPCHACGTTALGDRTSTEGPVETRGLCSACFEAQCEADALKYTGVSLKARHVRVPLLPAGIEASAEYAASKANPAEMQWLVTAFFRTRDNREHAREWSLLDNGDVVGVVTYDNDKRRYAAEALGVPLTAVDRSDRVQAAAMRLVQDVVMDARSSIERVVASAAAVEDRGAGKKA